MPPRRRTDPGKPPPSPTTSTSHASTDHHRLRHTGPTISTRTSTGAASPKPAHPEHTYEIHPRKVLRDKKLLADVSPPGFRTPFTKFLYTLLLVVLLLVAWYVYGMAVLLARIKEDVGWWGIISGDPRGPMRWGSMAGWRSKFGAVWDGTEKSGDVEASLNALADALGVPPFEVASAVKPLVPPASVASMASKSEKTGSSEAVRVLLEDTMRGDREGAARMAKEYAERMGGDDEKM